MYSTKIGVAGTVDLICEVDGELSIVDFKTAAKTKPDTKVKSTVSIDIFFIDSPIVNY